MKTRNHMFLGFLFIAMLLFVACDSRTEPENLEYSVAQTNTFLQLAGQPDEILDENCGSERDSKQTITRSRSFLTALEIEISDQVAAEFGGDAKLAEATLRAQIGASLSVRFGTELENSSALEIVTPPDTKTITTIQWKERWTTGDITIIRPDGSYLDVLPFLALNSLVLERQGVKTIRCDGDDEEIITERSTPEILPTLPPLIAPTPTPLEDIEIAGKDSDGTSWQAPTTGTYIITFKSGAYNGWENDAECEKTDHAEQGCWKTTIFIYRNCEIDWIRKESADLDEPGNPDFRIGDDAWQKSEEIATEIARLQDSLRIDLQQGECLKFVAIDGTDKETGWSAYSDNRGIVILDVSYLSP